MRHKFLLKQSYTVQRSSQFDIVYIWISKFNAIIATIYQLVLQCKHSYIRWRSNCGRCILCDAYFYTHKAKQPELTPSGRLVVYKQQIDRGKDSITYLLTNKRGFSLRFHLNELSFSIYIKLLCNITFKILAIYISRQIKENRHCWLIMLYT